MIQQFYAKLSDKERKVFYFAMGAIVLALFDALFLRPVQGKLKGMNEEIRERTNTIKRDLRILSYREKILVERQKLWEYYPKDEQTPDQIKAAFLQRIETVATEAAINLTKVSPSTDEEKKGFRKYYAELDCTGMLEDIVKFMHMIDATPDLLKVVKVTMTGKPNVKEVTANMTVVKIIPDPKAIWTESELRDIAEGKEIEINKPGTAGSGASGVGQSSISAGGGAGVGEGGSDGAQGGGPGGSGAPDSGGEGGEPGGAKAGVERIAVGGADSTAGEAAGGAAVSDGKKDDTAGQKKKADPKLAPPVTGERVQVKGITDLWNDFWGIKPKKVEIPDDAYKDVNWDEVEAEEEKKNVWEKMLKK